MAINPFLQAGLLNQSSAQVIDGSLRFVKTSENIVTHLRFTPSSTGNRRKSTFSCWLKRGKIGEGEMRVFNVANPTGNEERTELGFGNEVVRFSINSSGTSWKTASTSSQFRDSSGWYHFMWVLDSTQPNGSDQRKVYVNGILQPITIDTALTQNEDTPFNVANWTMYLGVYGINTQNGYDGLMSQAYWIDGLALGPGYFGFTDPKTGVWRPKKFRAQGTTVNNGTVWSNYVTIEEGNLGANYNANATNAFDGNTSTQTSLYSGATSSPYSATTAVFTPPSPITVRNRLRVRMEIDRGQKIFVNGVQTNSSISAGWNDVEFTGSLTSLKIGPSNLGSSNNINAIEVDGVIMVDSTTQNLSYGTNGFYFPMDGNSPIGEDKSGRGNNWTPYYFGGSAALDKATGALPILNTTNGGKVARPGVFGSEVSKYYTVTTANGSVYQFDITSGDNPSLSFIRGATYTFNYDSYSSHPLRFSSTNPDTSTTAYTDGTSVSGNVIKFTVPHNAPDTLYYYCTAHPTGMNGSISVTTDETKADPYAWKCTVAIPCLGTATDVSHLVNSTASQLPIVSIGNAQPSYSVGNFYGGSYDLDNTGDYININSTSPYSHVNFGTGDYTAECWVYLEGTGDEYVFNMATNNGGSAPWWGINFYSTNLIRAGRTNSSGDPIHMKTTTFATNKWMHIAVSRESGTSRLFLDGVLIDTQSDSYDIVPSSNLNIGAYNNGGLELNGFVQDARIYNGVAKYTKSFIPASTDPDILQDTPSGVSGGSFKFPKITDGAVAFDGSNDYIIAGNSADLAMGTGDFTLECFVYRSSSVSQFTNFIATRGAAASSNGFTFGAQASANGYDVEFYTSGMQLDGGNQLITPNKWHHVVITRSGTTLRSFVNGILNSTATNSQDFSNTSMYIGMTNDGSQGPMNGILSNVRVIKGSIPTEYQTSSTTVDTRIFTPPTEPLTTTSQGATSSDVKLLCCQSSLTPGIAAVSPNISGINNGTVWSDKLAATLNGDSSIYYPASRAFDGSASTSALVNSSSSLPCQSWTLRHTFTNVSTLQVEGRPDGPHAGDWIISGTGVQTQTVSNQGYGDAVSLTLTSSTVSNLNFTTDNTGAGVHISRIIVNGTVLVDPVFVEYATATNFNPFNTDINTVRGQETGYATWNPITNYGLNLFNGNLDWNGGTSNRYCRPTMFVNSGKWYCEFTMGSTSHIPGIIRDDHPDGSGILGELGSSRFQNNGSIGYSGANPVNGGLTWTVGDTVQLYMDMDNKAIYWGVNGIMKLGRDGRSGVPTSGELRIGAVLFGGMSGFTDKISFNSWGPSAGTSGIDASAKSTVNFGQKPFKYPPPEGYRPFNGTAFRPSKVVTRPSDYVGVATYVGNGGTQSIKVGFKPDFVWIKDRSSAYSNRLCNSVTGSTRVLFTDNPSTEQVDSYGTVDKFTSSGFDLRQGTNVVSADGSNRSGDNHVAWCWKAGGSGGGLSFWKDDVGYATASAVNMSAGNLNSLAYDTSQTWSNNLTVNTGSVSNATQAFNGNLANGADSSGSTGVNDRTMTATLGLTLINEYVYVYPNHTYSGYYATIDGVPQPIQYFTTQNGFKRMGPYTGTLTSVTVTNGTETSSRPAGIRAIKVGNKILVDSAVTPPNVPVISSSAASIGTKQGFSIIKYVGDGSGSANTDSGDSFAHGLTQAPDFVIVKNLNSANAFLAYHSAIDLGTMNLSSTATNDTSSYVWAQRHPSEYVVYLGNNPEVNNTGSNYIAYCWHNVPGLQKFGAYTGTGSAGNFVHLGFRPRIILIKTYSGGTIHNWSWVDSKRSYANVANHTLATNLAYGEGSFGGGESVFGASNKIDLVSNGFVLREASAWGNETSVGYIYAAWAEAPDFNLYGAQSNAR